MGPTMEVRSGGTEVLGVTDIPDNGEVSRRCGTVKSGGLPWLR